MINVPSPASPPIGCDSGVPALLTRCDAEKIKRQPRRPANRGKFHRPEGPALTLLKSLET
jgi:hypothetical protein